MRITQWGEYAVHFCTFMARSVATGHETVNASEISGAYNVDQLYAQQILQRLRKGKIIESVRGPQGGYKLSRSPEEITLYDILIAAEGGTFEIICENKPIDANRCDPINHCSLRTIWHDLKDHVNSFLTSRTLKDLVLQYPAENVEPIKITNFAKQRSA